MTTAVCWELTGPTVGFRLLIVDRFVGLQTLTPDNERPRWEISSFPTSDEASDHAVKLTTNAETMYTNTISVEPTEIIVHDHELSALSPQRPIPPGLRARTFTALHRHRQPSPA